MYKAGLLVSAIIFSTATADPYITSKHVFSYKNSDYNNTTNHVRLGNSWTTQSGLKLHAELGVAEKIDKDEDWFDGNAGKSYQFGFQKDLTSRFAVKGKYEGFEANDEEKSQKFEVITKFKF